MEHILKFTVILLLSISSITYRPVHLLNWIIFNIKY